MIVYEESKHTRFIRAMNTVLHEQDKMDQYQVLAFILDAVHGSTDYPKMKHKTLKGALGSLKKAFNCGSLMEYIEQKGLEEIDPLFAYQGSVVVVKDAEHDDIAFNVGSKWVFFNDNGITNEQFDIRTVLTGEHTVRAFQLT